MKTSLLTPLLLVSALLAPLSHAQFTSGDGERLGNNPHLKKAEQSSKPKKIRSVKDALAQMTFFNAEPSDKAQYYIFLRSASWCGPCQKEMPEIAKLYAEIKKSKKVELILWSADRSEEAGKQFLKQHEATFPATMDASLLTELKGSSGIPHAYVLDKKGKLIYRGHGSIVKNWKYATIDYRKNKKEIDARMKSLKASEKSEDDEK